MQSSHTEPAVDTSFICQICLKTSGIPDLLKRIRAPVIPSTVEQCSEAHPAVFPAASKGAGAVREGWEGWEGGLSLGAPALELPVDARPAGLSACAAPW